MTIAIAQRGPRKAGAGIDQKAAAGGQQKPRKIEIHGARRRRVGSAGVKKKHQLRQRV